MRSTERSPVHRWALVGLGLLLAYVAVLPTLVAAESLARSEPWSWERLAVFSGPLVASVIAVRVAWWMKSDEDRAVDATVGRALRTGALPDGADPDAWRPLLRQQTAVFTVMVWVLLLLGVCGGVLTAIAAAGAGHGRLGIWILAAAQEVAAVLLIGAFVLRMRNGRRLLAQSRPES